MNEFSSSQPARMRRRWRKAIFRLRNLPGGLNFFRYTSNKAYSQLLRWGGSTRIAHPSSIMIEVTNHCNLRCITCPREYEYGDKMDKGFIEIDQLKKIVDQAYPYVDSIGLTGLGETLMYKQLEESVDYIRSKSDGIIIAISINAHLPKSVEIATRLAEKIDTIQISIDGMNEVYDTIRLQGDYSFFIKNVREIAAASKNKRADIMFNMVVLKQNFMQMADIVRLAKDCGVRYVNFQTMNLASVTNWDMELYNFYGTREFKLALKAAKKAAAETHVEMSTFEFEKEPGFQKCLLPWGHHYISWNGYMTPCCAKPFPKELNFGNVFEEGLMTTLNNPDYKKFRQQWYDNETPDFCKRCHMVDLPKYDMETL